MGFIVEKLEGLSKGVLVEIFSERIKVFVVEQNCPYLEVDEYDLEALHILEYRDGLRGYCRIVEGEDSVSIGRVMVKKEYRSLGLGRNLVEKALEEIENKFSGKTIRISAQTYLVDFYRSFGFVEDSEPYTLDNIQHIDMVLGK